MVRSCNGGLGMPGLISHRLSERLVFLSRSLIVDSMCGREISVVFPELNSQIEGYRAVSQEV